MKTYINNRGISDQTIKKFNITWNDTTIFLGAGMYKQQNQPVKLKSGSIKTLVGFDDKRHIVITEGPWDVLSLDTIGISAITSNTGVMSFDITWLKPDKNYYVAFDHDEAGHKGMLKLWRQRPDLKFVIFTSDELDNKGDVNDYILKYGAEAMKKKLNEATTIKKGWVSEYNITFDFEEEIKPKKYKTPLSLSQDDTFRKEQAKNIPFTDIWNFPKREGQNYRAGICPFHDDHNASLKLKLNKNYVKCFVCDKAWDTIGFTMELNNLKFHQAITKLVGAKEFYIRTE